MTDPIGSSPSSKRPDRSQRDETAKGSKRRRTEPNESSSARQPLSGLLIAVSSAMMNSMEQKNHHEYTYNDIVNLCDTAGAKVTPQVHKKVSCVVATDSAVSSKSQRVRKAWSKGIPVVRVQWLADCIQNKQRLPMDQYHTKPNLDHPKHCSVQSFDRQVHECDKKHSVKDTLLAALDASKLSESSYPAERTMDLGCCCACHDSGATDCPWCVTCSANNKNYES